MSVLKGFQGNKKQYWNNVMDTFIKQNHDLLKGFHEVDVVVTVLLDLLEEDQLGLALGAEHSQQGRILLEQVDNKSCYWGKSYGANTAEIRAASRCAGKCCVQDFLSYCVGSK